MEKEKKRCYISMPEFSKLELAVKHLNEAYDEAACYLVGSTLERSDWRDIDIRMILDDEKFKFEFPDANKASFQLDTKWQIVNTALSMWLEEQVGLPVDFQIQPMSNANGKAHEGKPRHAIGLRLSSEG